MINLTDLFFYKKAIKILIGITKKDCFPSMIAKRTDTTYSHTVSLINIFEKAGLVVFEKKGRTKIISLTKKGLELQSYLKKASEIMEGGENVGKE